MQRQRSILVLIIVLVIAAVFVLANVPLRLGLDLQGGSQLTIQVKQPEDGQPQVIKPGDLEDLRVVIERRVNGLGVSEAIVQTAGNNQLLVQLPGVNDPKEAERVLGGTAKLEFRQETSNPEVVAEFQVRREELGKLFAKQQELEQAGKQAEAEANRLEIAKKTQQLDALVDKLYEPAKLTGKNLKRAIAAPITTGGSAYQVNLEFDSEGEKIFAEMTKAIAGTGRRIGIFLDDRLISAPTVDVKYAATGIQGGASISGGFDAKAASELAIQLRGGSLPFPVEVVENRTVGATLGQDSIQKSIYAGIGGLMLVLIFMVAYYRLPGVVADVSLLIYAVLNLAAFALLQVTLTLPGIAGFILSIGMAVDANVLIFERTREELRAGKTLYRSVENGFYRAFSSILDGNVTTLIACLVLFWLGSGLVKGFALTLAIGVSISMFTALTCSRTLLLFLLSFPSLRKPHLYCPKFTPATSPKPEVAS
ncbi:MAG: protein translocase subunit SecD [Cyanobacteriota bacterium SKYGB_h_bin112]|nr:protein translocase subunit SecD [Cyanobacteriota bacterium SKYGB_h_bin112]